jgi:myo-inositol-1(or 4)-monophosphatase
MEHELTAVAIRAARSAGGLLAKALWEEREINLKGYRDTVTDADGAAEAIVLSLIRSHFPDHSILAEESGKELGSSPYTWVVDPLDGTTNYARGHPTFSVSVAVLKDAQPVVGVVYDPIRSHLFAAQRGGGVIFNGDSARASSIDELASGLVALDWAHADEDRQEALRRLTLLSPFCRTVRSLGSAALALAWVGMGWLDVYFGTGLYTWDVAAGGLIVSEGGGRLTGWGGEPWEVGQRRVLATNGPLHETVLQLWEGAD